MAIKKVEERIDYNFKTGDLLEIVRKDGKKFESIVIEKYENAAFLGRVLKKDKSIGTSSWTRYDLDKTSRVQSLDECQSVKVLSRSVVTKANSSLKLNESVQRSNLTYYKTSLPDGHSVTLCICEGHGGWSFDKEESRALKESYFNSQISRLNNSES